MNGSVAIPINFFAPGPDDVRADDQGSMVSVKLDACVAVLDKAKRRADADTSDAIKEAAKKAGMSIEDYLAQRKNSSRGHLRKLQEEKMKI